MSLSSISQRALLIVCLVFLCANVCQGADVIGVVRDSVTQAPLSGVTVIAWDTGDTTFTDATGTYHLTNVPANGVTIVFGTDNYNALSLSTSSCSCPYPGDMNADGKLNSTDLNLAINVFFFNATDPLDPLCPIHRADVNADGSSNSSDLNLLIKTLFFNGAPPVNPCGP